jgi:hypothetical protein
LINNKRLSEFQVLIMAWAEWKLSAKRMKLIFDCPNQNKVFESADYRIVENKGVIIDEAENRALLMRRSHSTNPVRIAPVGFLWTLTGG